MSKELEALERIKKWFPFKINELEYADIAVIESALKRLEELETKTIPNMKEHYEMLKEERNILRNERTKLYKENEKKLKVFEIIKKKDVDVTGIKKAINVAIAHKVTLINAKTKESVKPYICYNISKPKSMWLTEEEFDSIVEVLL